MSTDNAQPTPSPEGHDAAMAAVFEKAQANATAPVDVPPANTTTNTPPSSERPAWLPAEFDSPEALLAAYQKASKPAEGTTPDPANASTEQAQTAVQDAGLDFDALQTEFADKGELSAETYAALEKGGIPKSMVDSYIAGQMAIANQLQTDVFGTVGGADAYNEMVTWASTNLTPAQVDAYDKAMDSGDIETIKLAVAGLQTRFQSANGVEPSLIGGGTGAGTLDSFGSTAELTAAMRDPRYAKDPAYRAEVQSKLGRSNSVF